MIVKGRDFAARIFQGFAAESQLLDALIVISAQPVHDLVGDSAVQCHFFDHIDRSPVCFQTGESFFFISGSVILNSESANQDRQRETLEDERC